MIRVSLITVLGLLWSGSAIAQTPTSTSQPDGIQMITTDRVIFLRARNLARQTAEQENGGLSQYRTQVAMHNNDLSEPDGVNPLPIVVDNGDSWTFQFVGGRPGEPASIETVVTVSKTFISFSVDYNGEIRRPDRPLEAGEMQR